MILSFPIHHTFAPHVDRAYLLKTFWMLCRPWQWHNGRQVGRLERCLGKTLNGECMAFSTGREALLALLKAMNIHKGDEVILQAYTCSVVPAAILAAKATPVYCDISAETLNLDTEKLETLITDKTRAIICQHTFGLPADTKTLKALCKRKNLLLIEDCAHCLPDSEGPEDIGKLGDALLLSFGRDKAISGVSGGAVVLRDAGLSKRVRNLQGALQHLSIGAVFRLLLYPLIYSLAKPLYGVFVGKVILKAAQTIGTLPPIVTPDEKQGNMPATCNLLPNALADLALHSLEKLRKTNEHRRHLTAYYVKYLKDSSLRYPNALDIDWPLQKVPIITNQAHAIRRELKQANILLDDGWCSGVINPAGINAEALGYTIGSCKVAEKNAEQILTLPTHPTCSLKQVKQVVHHITNAVS